MSAALASQDPLTVGASARIVTHTLMIRPPLGSYRHSPEPRGAA